MDIDPKVIQTHNLRGGYAVTHIINGGERIPLCLWTMLNIRMDDYLILRNGAGTTRYQVEEIENMVDPPDQKFILATFAPREAPAE